MEIRTLEAGEVEAVLQMLSAWDASDGWRGPESFRRQMQLDPTFQEHNIWVAVERGEVVACAQIHPRRLRILGHAIPTGGLGPLYTRREYRGRGVATTLVERAATAMRERGMELSLAFSRTPSLFVRLGWNPWRGQRSIVRRSDHKPPVPSRHSSGNEVLEVVALEPQRDRALAAVKAIHNAYSGSRNGTVIRDDALWDASLRLAGNPTEEFFVVRRGGLAVAYARATLLEEGLTITEMGRFEDGASALARLVASILEARRDDPLAPPGRTSEEVRSFAVMSTFDDIGLTVSLEHEGLASHPVDDDTGLIRCLNIHALAARLDVELLPDEDEAAFLRRILPPDGFVFWPADRF
jgi:predicted N-acetyltransferase YhbS